MKALSVGSALAFSMILAACAGSSNNTTGAVTGIAGGSLVSGSSNANLAASEVLVVVVEVPVDVQAKPMVGLCSGTLISKDLVLTAAHCFADVKSRSRRDSTVAAYALFHNLASFGDLMNESYSISMTYELMPGFGSSSVAVQSVKNDLALMKLTKPVSAKPMKILKGQSLKLNDAVMLAGYSNPQGQDGYFLRTIQSHVSALPGSMAGSNEIMVNNGDQSGATHGDSGGAGYLQVGDENFIWGVTSSGVKMNGIYYQSYEPVSPNLAWLHSAAKALKGDDSF